MNRSPRVVETLLLLALVTVLQPSARAQRPTSANGNFSPTSSAVQSKQGSSRITQAIDDNATVRVKHSTHPLAVATNDRGRVDASLPLRRIMLMFQPSAQQKTALNKVINAQHDPASPTFQQWLTPGQFGATFGPTDAEVDQVSAWLQQHGFELGALSAGRQWIEFSGTAAQVEGAFHTEIHNYVVNGENHVANANDIAIPQALAPVVAGLLSLHNFRPKPMHREVFQVKRDLATGKFQRTAQTSATARGAATPNLTTGGGNHFLAPGDWARIYNTQPLLKSGVTGAGSKIAIVGSDSGIQFSDLRTFRAGFGLPAKDPTIVINGEDPGIFPFSSAEVEAVLDLEWSGAIAPDADQVFVTAASTASTPGFELAIAEIVDKRLAPIMSISIGGCELFFGDAGNQFLNNIYQQAAAEGITVMSAAGDSGAAGCDPQESFFAAQFGRMVNASASTPFNVAIGGTQFAENGQESTFWQSTNRADLSSAIGYIPEAIWNETCDPTITPDACSAFVLSSGSGGASNCVKSTIFDDGTFSCDAGYPKPSWQAGIGVPDDGARDLPDISFTAAGGHDGYLICVEGTCQTTTTPDGQTVLSQASVVGGTSAGAPSFAGVMALIEQKKGNYQGLVNYRLYQLAAAEDLSACNSSNLTDPNVPANCVFYDVTAGNNDVPGQPGDNAAPGFDLASGLGSVNVAKLLEGWDTTTKLGTRTKLSSDGGHRVQHGQPIPMRIAVRPTKGNGAPSGDFDLFTSTGLSVLGGTLTNGNFDGGINNLPGGEYRVTAHYGGDAMFNPSDSGSAEVKITPEDSTLKVVAWNVNFVGVPIPVDGSVNYGQFVGLQVDVAGKSGVGNASGNISVKMDDKRTLGPFLLNNAGNVFVELDTLQPSGLVPGDHHFVVSYSGDNSFKPGVSASTPLLVNKAGALQALTIPLQGTYFAGVPVDFFILIAHRFAPFGLVPPTGTVQVFECDTQDDQCPSWHAISKPIQLANDGPAGPNEPQATARLTFAAGNHLVASTYSGDNNYDPVELESNFSFKSFLQVDAPGANAATLYLKQSLATVPLAQTDTYTLTVKPANAGPVPTGNVTVFDLFGDVIAGPAPLVQGTVSFNVPWFNAGQQLLIAGYDGDSNYPQLWSPSLLTTVAPGQTSIALAGPGGIVKANTQTTLSVLVGNSPSGAHITIPGAEFGQVEYFDSVNGGPAQVLGSGPTFLTVGNGNTSTNVFPVVLGGGRHVITAKFLGAPDWAPSTSNSVVIQVAGQKDDEDKISKK